MWTLWIENRDTGEEDFDVDIAYRQLMGFYHKLVNRDRQVATIARHAKKRDRKAQRSAAAKQEDAQQCEYIQEQRKRAINTHYKRNTQQATCRNDPALQNGTPAGAIP